MNKKLNSIIKNYENGNLSDARKMAKGVSEMRLFRYMLEDLGMPFQSSLAIARKIKQKIK